MLFVYLENLVQGNGFNFAFSGYIYEIDSLLSIENKYS